MIEEPTKGPHSHEGHSHGDDKKFWPAHWVKRDEKVYRQKYVALYSKNSPEKELAISLKHFRDLGYDAEGAGDTKRRAGIIYMAHGHKHYMINIMPDELGTSGSSIIVQTISKKRK